MASDLRMHSCIEQLLSKIRAKIAAILRTRGFYSPPRFNQSIKNIIDNFLPGPITLILKSKMKFAEGVTKKGNVAIRIPKHNTSLELAKETPLITTRVNKHGQEISKNIEEAKGIFGSKCLYLEGEKPEGIESTIIDMTQNKPKIKRIGALYSSILEGIIES